METEELKLQLKKQIVEFLNLLSVKPEDIKDDEPLFGEGLGLVRPDWEAGQLSTALRD